ncbi:MAG: toxin-antitoxin system HicB family antitoxin [Acidobacteriota bacterium]
MAASPNRRRPSGRFLLRVDPALHAELKASAVDLGLSLNDYCSRKLALPVDAAALAAGAPAVVRQAADLHGDDLLGVIVFGSWARGDADGSSDVDVLIVLDRRTPLARRLYREWDARPARWDGRPVEVHLVHLPEPGRAPSGLWAEVALDGLVVYERGRQASETLGAVRRLIAEGRLVRRTSQGQPYWSEVA